MADQATLKRAMALKPKIEATTSIVLRDFIKRDDIVRAVWLALLSDSAAFFLGPPGVAKTATVQRLAREITGCVFFEALMPAIVSADQLFVESTSIEEHPTDDGGKAIAVKNKLGRATKAHVFFADEVWKTEPMVLQPLLDLARADGVRHDGSFHSTPIMAFLAASNELPEEGSKLGAMWSRMIIRVDVRGLDRSGRKAMVASRLRQERKETVPQSTANDRLSVEDLKLLQEARPHVELPDEIIEIILDLIEELTKQDEVGFGWLREDDRRFGFICDVLQSAALLAGRTVVTKADLATLEWMMWNEPSQIPAIKAVLAPLVRTPAGEAQEMVDALLAPDGVVDGFLQNKHEKSTDALRQCRETMAALEELAKNAGPDAPAVRTLIDNVKATAGAVAKKAAGL